jgi:hypothetical protein
VTRREAVAEQTRLFPDATLPDIALAVRAATNGSADPWEPENMREVVAMLRVRLETWDVSPRTLLEAKMDRAVREMVSSAIVMGVAWLAANEEPS